MLRKHSLFDKTKLFVSKEEAGLLISFTTLIIKLMIVNRMQQATFVRILLICFDHISNRSHPSLHPDQVKWWTSNCLPTGRFRPFSTGESWNNTNMMMIFDSDLFYCLFLYFWVCFDRSRLKSRVERRGLDSLHSCRENQNIAGWYFTEHFQMHGNSSDWFKIPFRKVQK